MGSMELSSSAEKQEKSPFEKIEPELIETRETKIAQAQQELIEKFGLKKTADFQSALQKGEIGLAEEWLSYIVKHQENFPQYEITWDSWLSDRQNDIKLYQELKAEGSLEKMDKRSKEEAKAELNDKFGFADTNGFRKTLFTDLEKAEDWLNYIVENKMSFPQYLASWDTWLRDRQDELAAVKL